MSGRQGGRPSSPRSCARWRATAFYASAAGAAAAAAAFLFCVIASVAYGWHTAVTKPGIAVSAAVLVACALALNLTGDEQ